MSGRGEDGVSKSELSDSFPGNENSTNQIGRADQNDFDAAGPAAPQTVVFPFTPSQLGSLVDPKDPGGLAKLGGVLGVCQGLRVDPAKGHTTGSGSTGVLAASRRAFGGNVIPHPAPPTFLWFLWEAYKDRTLLFLSGAALVSLSIGVYEDVKGGTLHHWIEGAAILLAVCLVVLVGAVNDWQKDRQFRALSAKAEDRLVRVLRDGLKQQVSIFELVVGDVVLLDPGDVLPADGLLLESHGLVCDESGATGESDQVKKDPAKDPFFISGTKVLDGSGSMLAIGVGLGSFHGRMLLAMRVGAELTPLQAKLNRLAEGIARLGFLAAASMFAALMVKWVVQHALRGAWPPASELLSQLLAILIQAVTVVVVAVPEGLPMAVTLALAFATTRMLQDRNLVRVLSACETMGNATSICTDKTGTLTENRMTVVRARLLSSPVIEDVDAEGSKALAALLSSSSSIALDLVGEAIALNSTAFSAIDPATGRVAFVGSKTEAALLGLLARLHFDYGEARSRASVARLFPFASERKTMSTVIRTRRPNGVPCLRLHTKGASEIVLRMCASAMRADGTVADLAEEDLAGFRETIEVFARASLRTIAVAFRDFAEPGGGGGEDLAWLGEAAGPPADGLTLLAVLGIADPLRPGVPEAVAACQRAGIVVRMVTGDNLLTARSIASQCGILMRGGLVMEGPAFRQLDEAALLEAVPRLQVLARSSPLDKQILVRALRSMGEVVAVTGDGTNDGPAMRAANVSFAMGIAGTEVAKEASSIVLLDDNFTSILRAVLWGRCVNDAVRKFLQFQLTVNLSAVVVAFASALVDAEDRSVLSAIQLLWVNLIMDSLAALALATDTPSDALLDRHPEAQEAPLITPGMWRMILGQAAFQIAAILLLTLLAPSRIRLLSPGSPHLSTFIFNTFVFLQLFNELNCRRLDARLNVFAGITRNALFLGIWWGTVAVQALIVAFGGAAFNTAPLGWELWVLSIAIGAISLPLGALIRLLPCKAGTTTSAAEQRPYMSRERLQWQAAADNVRRGLRVFSALRRSYAHAQQQPEQQ